MCLDEKRALRSGWTLHQPLQAAPIRNRMGIRSWGLSRFGYRCGKIYPAYELSACLLLLIYDEVTK